MKKRKLKQVTKLVNKAIRTGRKISALGKYSDRIRKAARRAIQDQHRAACMCVDQAIHTSACADIISAVDLFDEGTVMGNRSSTSTVKFFIKHEDKAFPISFKFAIADIDVYSVIVSCLGKEVDVTARFNKITDDNIYVYGECNPDILTEIWSRAITALLVEFAGNAKHDATLPEFLVDDSDDLEEWEEEFDEEDEAVARADLVQQLVALAPDVIYYKVERLSHSRSRAQIATILRAVESKQKGTLISIATWLNHFLADRIDLDLSSQKLADCIASSLYVKHKPLDEDSMSDEDWSAAVGDDEDEFVRDIYINTCTAYFNKPRHVSSKQTIDELNALPPEELYKCLMDWPKGDCIRGLLSELNYRHVLDFVAYVLNTYYDGDLPRTLTETERFAITLDIVLDAYDKAHCKPDAATTSLNYYTKMSPDQVYATLKEQAASVNKAAIVSKLININDVMPEGVCLIDTLFRDLNLHKPKLNTTLNDKASRIVDTMYY